MIQGNYEKIDKTSVSKSELEDFFKKFTEEEYYERAEKKGACLNCPYLEICRREVM